MKRLILLFILVTSCNEHNLWKREFKYDLEEELFECAESGNLSEQVLTSPDFVPMLSNCTKDGLTPLLIAAKNGHINSVLMFAYKVDIGQRGRNGHTALTLAIANNREDIVNQLVVQGIMGKKANVNIKMSDSTTPLMIAAKNGLTSIAQILISSGEKETKERVELYVNETNKYGITPLMFAAMGGN